MMLRTQLLGALNGSLHAVQKKRVTNAAPITRNFLACPFSTSTNFEFIGADYNPWRLKSAFNWVLA